jgi:hypothetical protein
MTPQDQHNVYRAALEFANTELTEINSEIESLQKRKELIERALVALKSLVLEGDSEFLHETSESYAASSEAEAPEKSEVAGEVPVEAPTAREPLIADPFQRRVDHALGIGAGIRDVRNYSRQL